MRISRLKRFKKKKKLMLVSKLVAIFYLATFTFSYLSSGTGAYFINSNSEKQVIEAGTWWDGSDLVFLGKSTQTIKACPPLGITVEIKNNGFGMIGSSEYEVYYSENGNPKNQGVKIAEGNIAPIDEGQTDALTYKAEKIGTYMFKAEQRPDYNGEGKSEIWSEKVMVKCIEKQEDSTKDDKQEDPVDQNKSDQSNEETDSDSQTDSSKEEGTDSADESEDVNKDDDKKQEDKQEQDTAEKTKDSSSGESDKSTKNTGVEEDKKTENETTVNKKQESETNAEEGDSANEQTK